MAVTLETIKGLEKKLTISVPSEEIVLKQQDKIKQLAPKVKIDGFRAGKVPLKVVEKRFGEQVRDEVIGDLIKSTLADAIKQENLDIAGMPTVEPKEYQSGQPFEYSAVFEVMPVFEVTNLAGIEVEQVVSEIADADIEGAVEKLRKQHAEWLVVDRAAINNDRVLIDFDGFIDEKPLEGGQANSFQLELGSKSMIPGFEDGLIGAKANSELVLDLTFPDEYHDKAIQGKAVKFNIKVREVSEAKLPELNDALAEKFDIKEGGIQKLRDEIRENMTRELKNAVTTKNKEVVFEQLLKNNTIDLPTALIDSEIERLKEQFYDQMAQGNKKKLKNLPELPRNMFEEQAKRRVGLGLIVSEYIKVQAIKVDAAKIDEKLEQLASAYADPESLIQWYKSDKSRLAEVESIALEEEVVKHLLQDSKIKEKKESYKTLLKVTEN